MIDLFLLQLFINPCLNESHILNPNYKKKLFTKLHSCKI